MATDLERELERTTALRGFRYGLHDFVAAVGGVEALKRHNDNTQATYLKHGLLDRKTKELLIIAACVASGDLVSHIQIHMHAAQKAGATPEEIMEALKLAPCGRTVLVHHVPGSLPTSPSNPQSCQCELSHELFPIPASAHVWWG